MKSKKLLFLLVGALCLKLLLFAGAVSFSPEMIFEHDSHNYYQSAMNIVHEGKFASDNNGGSLAPEFARTPGYPMFLAVLNGYLRLPINMIILIQVLLTLLAAFFTYKTALLIDHRLALISIAIVLFDPPSSIFSLMIMTDTLFFCMMAALMYYLVLTCKTKEMKYLIISAILIGLGTYVRPVSLYLGYAVGAFILFADIQKNPKKAFIRTAMFLIIVYGIISLWMVRNYKLSGKVFFSQVASLTLLPEGLYKSYERNMDETSQGLHPVLYYANVSSRCLISYFTRPATLKYFKNRPLTVFGKIICYPWIVFWITGFLIGLAKMRGNTYFYLFAIIILYFTAVTVCATMWGAGPRFRMPIVPFMAIISAYGWLTIQSRFFKGMS